MSPSPLWFPLLSTSELRTFHFEPARGTRGNNYSRCLSGRASKPPPKRDPVGEGSPAGPSGNGGRGRGGVRVSDKGGRLRGRGWARRGMGSADSYCLDVCCSPRSRSSSCYFGRPLDYSKPLGIFHRYFQCCCAFWDQMKCFDRSLRRVGPEEEPGKSDVVCPPQGSRVNGWSLPLHSFQGIAWAVYSYMAVVGFGIYIPLLPYAWKHGAYTVVGAVFAFHLIIHLAAVTIDPADPNVRSKKDYGHPMPALDRSKHKHAIQNQYCHLCQVSVGPRAKHCSTCNKCIAEFDHHCKWLNNCVGSRNYWYFFSSVASAVIGVVFLTIVILYVFIQHFVNPMELRTAPQFEGIFQNNTWLMFLPLAPVESPAAWILLVAAITLCLAITSLFLLGHLLLFHLYLLGKQLSTFDYMTQGRRARKKRNKMEESSPKADHLKDWSSRCFLNKNRNMSSPSRTSEDPHVSLASFQQTKLRKECPPWHLHCQRKTSKGQSSPKSSAGNQNIKERDFTPEKDNNDSPLEVSSNSDSFSSVEIPAGTMDSLMLLYSAHANSRSDLHEQIMRTVENGRIWESQEEPSELNCTLTDSKEAVEMVRQTYLADASLPVSERPPQEETQFSQTEKISTLPL
ncbi:LOW QUALITY PROTEIN: palmitoyltransferase ZDHHC1-like [Tachyglossus aculeatus]|uniref:LOW QUALITY PROTEIN: palmitoyltransferase ZDHHC1-like n=1 Tax=Tachyglossus aculeatus TaxID=9261 RepID=UPI0018F6059F|nr:LOW QUALITY PROTEIN: palmitoyltransferase ZDHHC1-like [Tachyglossus aculeatus]